MMRAVDYQRAGTHAGTPFDRVVLAHDERHLRRKLLIPEQGGELLVDLAEPVALQQGDVLVLEDGRLVEVIAGEEDLYEVHGRNQIHLMELCWHLGNRHLPCQIDMDGKAKRLLILRDHVIRDMLTGLGADVVEVSAPFAPVRGAYHTPSHDHGHHPAVGQDHHHE